MFLLLVQLPLSGVSAAWSFMTCFLVWCLDSDTKQWIYDVTRCLLVLDTEALRGLWRKEFDFFDMPLRGSKEERHEVKAVVDWACLNLFIVASLASNYIYRTFFKQWVTAFTLALIRLFDQVGFEIHFVRFV